MVGAQGKAGLRSPRIARAPDGPGRRLGANRGRRTKSRRGCAPCSRQALEFLCLRINFDLATHSQLREQMHRVAEELPPRLVDVVSPPGMLD